METHQVYASKMPQNSPVAVLEGDCVYLGSSARGIPAAYVNGNYVNLRDNHGRGADYILDGNSVRDYEGNTPFRIEGNNLFDLGSSDEFLFCPTGHKMALAAAAGLLRGECRLRGRSEPLGMRDLPPGVRAPNKPNISSCTTDWWGERDCPSHLRDQDITERGEFVHDNVDSYPVVHQNRGNDSGNSHENDRYYTNSHTNNCNNSYGNYEDEEAERPQMHFLASMLAKGNRTRKKHEAVKEKKEFRSKRIEKEKELTFKFKNSRNIAKSIYIVCAYYIIVGSFFPSRLYFITMFFACWIMIKNYIKFTGIDRKILEESSLVEEDLWSDFLGELPDWAFSESEREIN